MNKRRREKGREKEREEEEEMYGNYFCMDLFG